jgi:hypothetical protein
MLLVGPTATPSTTTAPSYSQFLCTSGHSNDDDDEEDIVSSSIVGDGGGGDTGGDIIIDDDAKLTSLFPRAVVVIFARCC